MSSTILVYIQHFQEMMKNVITCLSAPQLCEFNFFLYIIAWFEFRFLNNWFSSSTDNNEKKRNANNAMWL